MRENMKSLAECKEMVMEFLTTYCQYQHGNDLENALEKLLSFDIGGIKNDTKFGKPENYPKNWSMDPDDSVIARTVFYLLYNEEIMDLSYDMMGTQYRGDTIFTPGNIFGKEKQFLQNQNITKKSTCEERVNQFLQKYHTIPNMMLLPNEKIEVFRKNKNGEYVSKEESLNQYRGMNNPGLSDYIDLFIMEIYNSIENNHAAGTKHDNISCLLAKNDFYFRSFKHGIEFLESHFLDDTVRKIGNTYEIIDDYKFKHVVWWRKDEDYETEAEKFLKAFDRLWNYRKNKMLRKLQEILNQSL